MICLYHLTCQLSAVLLVEGRRAMASGLRSPGGGTVCHVAPLSQVEARRAQEHAPCVLSVAEQEHGNVTPGSNGVGSSLRYVLAACFDDVRQLVG